MQQQLLLNQKMEQEQMLQQTLGQLALIQQKIFLLRDSGGPSGNDSLWETNICTFPFKC